MSTRGDNARAAMRLRPPSAMAPMAPQQTGLSRLSTTSGRQSYDGRENNHTYLPLLPPESIYLIKIRNAIAARIHIRIERHVRRRQASAVKINRESLPTTVCRKFLYDTV